MTEEFQGYSQPTDDNARMYKVIMDRCNYKTIFVSTNGLIELSIEHPELNYGCTVLVYYDKVNKEASNSDALDDL